jgi:hypothetical protein
MLEKLAQFAQRTMITASRRLVAALALTIFTLCVRPLPAVTFGTIDTDNAFANVGSIVVTNHPAHDFHPLEGTLQAGSGTLIHPRVFLTAGHVTADIQGDLDAGILAVSDIHVSFSPSNDMDPKSWHDVEALITHPLFNPVTETGRIADWHDVGLVILKHPVRDIPCATLPYAGLLDDLEDAGLLNGGGGAEFVAVGYGATMDRSPPQVNVRIPNFGAPRQYAVTEFRLLEEAWLVLNANPNSGDGGTAPGDSGGPRFWITPDGELILAAITSNGPLNNVSYDNTYRIDTAETLAFLDLIVATFN